MDIAQIEYLDIEKNVANEELIKKVIKTCFEEEGLLKANLYISITLTNPEHIQEINKSYRNVDNPTDVLSFPMFEKEELEQIIKHEKQEVEDVLGDIIISIPKVQEQAQEYGHSFERELAYMVVHGFYHLMGYDHMEEQDKIVMRAKEENILKKLNITRA